MMRQERSGIMLLLGLLLLLSSVLSMLHAQSAPSLPTLKEPVITPPSQLQLPRPGGLATVSTQEALRILTPYIQSRSLENIVALMKGLSVARAQELVHELAKKLSRNDMLNIIIGIAHEAEDKVNARALFPLIREIKNVKKGEPILYIAALSQYPKIIKLFAQWLVQNYDPALIGKTVQYAAKRNDVSALRALNNNGVVIDPDFATHLLWYLLDEKNKNRQKLSPEVVAFLVLRGANIDYSADEKYTILMKGILLKKPEIVAELLKALHYDIHRMEHNEVGTALQLTLLLQDRESQKKNKEAIRDLLSIEQMLRNHGALELFP